MCLDCDLQHSLIHQNMARAVATLAGAASTLGSVPGSEAQVKEILATISQLALLPEPAKAEPEQGDVGTAATEAPTPKRRKFDMVDSPLAQAFLAAIFANQELNPGRRSTDQAAKAAVSANQGLAPEYEYSLVAPYGAPASVIEDMRQSLAARHGIDPAAIQVL